MKVVGQMVCGPGEADRWLEVALMDFQRLCDDVIIAACGVGEKEIALFKKYDFRYYHEDREWGHSQYEIKTDLLRRIRALGTDWIIALDADESMPTMTREEFEMLANGRDAMQFYVVDLWNDAQHYRRSMSFWNVRAYRPGASTDSQFLRKPVHCGNAPPYFYSVPAKKSYVPHILLHRGLMLREERQRRIARYNRYDPRAVHKGKEYYDALADDVGGTLYDESEVLGQLQKYVSTLSPR